MVAMAGCVRVLLAVAALASGTGALVDEAIDVIMLSKHIGEEVLQSWDVLNKPFNITSGVELPIIRRKERLVLSRLSQISRSIAKLELEVEKTGAVALLLAKANQKRTTLELKLHDMADLLSRISSKDDQMRKYVRLQHELERSTLENFVEWCVSHDSLPELLERVHALVVPPHSHLLGRGILELIVNDMEVT